MSSTDVVPEAIRFLKRRLSDVGYQVPQNDLATVVLLDKRAMGHHAKKYVVLANGLAGAKIDAPSATGCASHRGFEDSKPSGKRTLDGALKHSYI
jgi:hypothetical protein